MILRFSGAAFKIWQKIIGNRRGSDDALSDISALLHLCRKGCAAVWVFGFLLNRFGRFYSGLNLNQDKATKPQTVRIVRQGEVTPSWFKVNPL